MTQFDSILKTDGGVELNELVGALERDGCILSTLENNALRIVSRENVEISDVAKSVQKWLKKWHPYGSWSCQFDQQEYIIGGGVVFVTANKISYMYMNLWLKERRSEHQASLPRFHKMASSDEPERVLVAEFLMDLADNDEGLERACRRLAEAVEEAKNAIDV